MRGIIVVEITPRKRRNHHETEKASCPHPCRRDDRSDPHRLHPRWTTELVYDSIFGGGSSSTGSTGTGNHGSTGGNTGGNTGGTRRRLDGGGSRKPRSRGGPVEFLKKGTYTSSTYANITPVYDIPHLEEFVKAIDEYCTKECETNGKSWEATDLPKEKLEELATGVLNKETCGRRGMVPIRERLFRNSERAAEVACPYQ